MLKVPESYECVGDVMSNFDHKVEDWAEEKLKSGDYYGGYAAWNFHGHVWFADGSFHVTIRCYGSHVDTVTEDTLQDIMDTCSELYGSE